MKMPRGEAAARYVREHGGTLIEAARLFGLSRERVRQKWRDLFGDAELPSREAQRQRLAEIEELARQGLTQTEIAAELGIQRRAVAHLCAAADLTLVQTADKLRVTDETRAKILRLAREGESRAEIARDVGFSFSIVCKILRGHSTSGGTPRPGRRRGASAHASDIMDRTGCSLHEAAARFTLSPPALYAYRKRRGLWTRTDRSTQ